MGIAAETITVMLFPRIGDFAMLLFTSDGIEYLLTLGTCTVNDTSCWEETVRFLLLLDKVVLSTVMLLDKFEDGAVLVGNVCTELKIFLLVFMSLDGDGEQGTLAR